MSGDRTAVIRRSAYLGQLVDIDFLPMYRKYTDLFDVDSVPEPERMMVARQVASQVAAHVSAGERTGGSAIT